MSDDLALALERVSIEGTGPKKVNSTVTMTVKLSEQNSLSINISSSKAININHASLQPAEGPTTSNLRDAIDQGARSGRPSAMLVSNGAMPNPNSVKPGRKHLFLDLPYELRRRVYEVLIRAPHTVALNYFTPSERRIGVLEPLRLTCKILYAEVTQWGLAHPDLAIRSPMWGLYNCQLTYVCVRFLDSSNKSAYIFMGNPLTSEDIDKIALWWRCMKNARSDYFREVNKAIRWDKLVKGNRHFFYEYTEGEFKAEVERYMMPCQGESRAIDKLPL